MKLYTFQPTFIWEGIQKDGFYHPFDLYEKNEMLKEDLEIDWGFPHAYNWLKKKMLEKGISYRQYNEYMIWGWYQWSGKSSKPDKRYSSVFDYKDEPYVMLELDIDESRVLLSDYETWHTVLNYWLFDIESVTDKFSETYDYYKEKPLSNKEAHLAIEKSWETIFDMEKSRTLWDFPKDQQSIQATFFEIFKEDVKKVHYFENKKCIKIEKI